MTDVYYRFQDRHVGTGSFDVDGDYTPGPSYVTVEVCTYEVDKKTPKGAWVWTDNGREFIADRWFCKYANPTLEGARADFIARKKKLIAVQTRRIHDAEEAIKLATENRARSLYAAPIKVPDLE